MNLSDLKVAVIGLGYVGLPLAVEFGKKYDTLGFDISQERINELINGSDSTLELNAEELKSAPHLNYSSNIDDLKEYSVYIVTVPTPIDRHKQPDLSPLIQASKMLGKVIRKNNIVIYESTVYPGATEEDCIPVIEKESGLRFNADFFAGYSPERINPGDKAHRITNILKVTSGSTPEIADLVDELYKSVISAGTHKASSIRVAEAAKVIENVQRDVNIALINELHQIFTQLNINTKEVIEAASTKWNFMKLLPGLVGGHCIGVDPYYLLHKSQVSGYIPDLIRKAREINDGMSSFIGDDFIKQLIKKGINPVNCKVLLLGITFKENCPDIRNSKAFDVYNYLTSFGLEVAIEDPWANPIAVKKEYNIEINKHNISEFDAAILLVGHKELIENASFIEGKLKSKFIYDYKGFLNT